MDSRREDSLRTRLAYLVKQFRARTDLELELRLGQFSAEGRFTPGFTHDHIQVVQRLLKRFHFMSQHHSAQWTTHPQHVYVRSFYENNIRHTHSPSSTVQAVESKTKLTSLDIGTSRPYQLRCCLSQEQALTTHAATTATTTATTPPQPPLRVQLAQRASFTELVPTTETQYIQIRYDITKTSPYCLTKAECTSKQCVYHFEMELVKQEVVAPTFAHSQEQENDYIVELLLTRACTMLGTHDCSTDRRLPEAGLYSLKYTQ
jgi:hypothetical protein